MSITRRKFLRAGTLVALSAAMPLKAAGQQPRKGNDGNPIDQLRHHQQHESRSFLIRARP